MERLGWGLRLKEIEYDKGENMKNHHTNLHVMSNLRRVSREAKQRFKRSVIKTTVLTSRPRKTRGTLEEANLAMVEICSPDIGSQQVDEILVNQKEPKIPTHERKMELGSDEDDDYENEDWRSYLLQEGSKHVARLNLCIPPRSWSEANTMRGKLSVQRDEIAKIPDELRQRWYNLVYEVRLYQAGSKSEYEDIEELTTHLESYGTRPYTSEMGACQGILYDDDSLDIQDKYDTWYWNIILYIHNAVRLNIPLRRLKQILKEISYKDHELDTEDEWRSHHYFMYDAIRRNKELRNLPPWIGRC
jgi:hypothetical protein